MDYIRYDRYLKLFNPLCDLFLITEKHWLSGDSQNPAALERIKNLENLKASLPLETSDGQDFGPPTFQCHLNDVECSEGDSARFECVIEPKNDPNLQIGRSFIPN